MLKNKNHEIWKDSSDAFKMSDTFKINMLKRVLWGAI